MKKMIVLFLLVFPSVSYSQECNSNIYAQAEAALTDYSESDTKGREYKLEEREDTVTLPDGSQKTSYYLDLLVFPYYPGTSALKSHEQTSSFAAEPWKDKLCKKSFWPYFGTTTYSGTRVFCDGREEPYSGTRVVCSSTGEGSSHYEEHECNWILKKSYPLEECAQDQDGDDDDGDTGSGGGGSNLPGCEDADGDGVDDYDTQICPTGSDMCPDNINLTDPATWYKDADGDGYSDGTTLNQCEAPTGYTLSAQPGDCNDNNSNINPNSPEVCDNKDNNCNGGIDEGVKTTWYKDADNDGYYPAGGTTEACEAPAEYVASAEPKDCNDSNAAINPGATEKCGVIDYNCNDVKSEGCNSCSITKNTGSTANIANGNLFHDQPLFSELTLYYNSINSYEGPLGTGWNHSYDISVTELGDGSALFRGGSGRLNLYTPSDGVYVAQTGNSSSLTKNSDGSFVISHKDGSSYGFNSEGKIAVITDHNGNANVFGYEGGGLVSVTDTAGKTITFANDIEGNVLSITDPSGNDYGFAYDGDRNLIEVSYPSPGGSSSSWNYSYYSKGMLESKTDLEGYMVTYVYDEDGRVLSSTTSEGENHTIEYSDGQTTTQMILPDGGVWNYSYDPAIGEMTSQTDPGDNVTSYTYDVDRNMLSKTDPDGSTASYTYDEYGNRTSETDAAGSTTSYTYNQYGQVLSVTDAEGNKSSYAYDEKGNLSSTTDASGASTSYKYDAKGNVTKITDSTGGETHMVYDGSNNLTSVRDTSGATTFFAYDDAGNLTGQTDANGNTTTFEYNSLNQLIKVTDPQGKATSYSYDRSGNRTSQTDANGNITYYEYNHKGQVIKVTDALAGETKYTYGGTSCSACGSKGDNLTSITDAKGNTTKFEYDHLSRLVKEIDPLGYSTSYSYDARGSLASKTDAEGNTINFNYDALGRLLGKSYPDNTGESYSYNSKGNLLTAINQNMGYSFTYDAGNRVTSVTDSNGRAISYSYDTSGRKTKMTGPNGEEIDYSYDESNRLNSIDSDAGDFIFTYDSLGRRVGLSYPHGASASYSYDTSGRLTDLTHKTSGASVIASNSYSHDNVGNRLTNESNTRTAVYQYDDIYRLNEANYTTPGFSTTKNDKGKGKNKGLSNAIANQTEVYTYDPVGNRLTSEKSNVYTYNKANQIESFNGITYKYDKNGNLISKENADEKNYYSYDYENRLIRVDKQEGDKITVVNFKYDPFGRRIEKSVVKDGVTTITKFFYDNEDILFEYDESGNVGNRYIHGPGIDEPLALIQKKGYYYHHADGLGSIVALTDEKQTVVQDYDYGYFGQLKNQKNRIKQPYKYTGREWDKETGLYYYRARYYDADLGQFTQKDPIGFAGGDVNLYSYVQQNPVNFIDPWGLQTVVFNQTGSGTYNSTVLVMPDANTIIGSYQGSSLPNPGKYPTVQSGSYPYTTGMHNPGKPNEYPALIINNGGAIPTTASNPNNPTGAATADNIQIHKGQNSSWRGSAGCFTVQPDNWSNFMTHFPSGTSGNVIILQ